MMFNSIKLPPPKWATLQDVMNACLLLLEREQATTQVSPKSCASQTEWVVTLDRDYNYVECRASCVGTGLITLQAYTSHNKNSIKLKLQHAHQI